MKVITKVDGPPVDPREFDLPENFSPNHIEDIAEIFETPMTGHYNWDYTDADSRIKKLYELGKELNWDGEIDLDWSKGIARDEYPIKPEMVARLEGPLAALPEEKRLEYMRHDQAWALSQFLHGEQGALLVASQLVSCAPTYQAKLYAASQTFDEARHVEVFSRYLQRIHGLEYPVNKNLKALLDKTLTDPRWDLKFIGMQIVIEGLALAAFQTTKETSNCPLLRQLVHYVIRDEARHVTFGINYLTEFLQTLSEEELEERAQFAYEACVVMRRRIINTELPAKWFGISEDEAFELIVNQENQDIFNNLLFNRVMPNLKKIGLLTEKIQPLYDELNLLAFAESDSDFEVDWAEMKKPLEDSKEIDRQSAEQLAQHNAAGLF
ncbi:MAG: ferritin-like domain-containing protein [Pseudomonadota bacterium]|nr:ferritin [Gammaproteobacteria bacterium]MEC7917252.1 ferritin-like domain-containing protein [Pseudomonadota bacterium]|tara:strand:+ start:1057 stop:2199 length:1143 start_codon:yes stop_codon:yes gene_type:complete